MTSNGNDGRKRKLLVPNPLNLENLSLSESLINFDDYVCSSPKAPKSPKFCISKEELPKRNQGHCPQCIICIEDLIIFDDEPVNKENGKPSGCCQRPIVMTNCGHAFHTGCINKWFMEHKDKEFKTCPLCRKEMRSNDTRRLFLVCGEDFTNRSY